MIYMKVKDISFVKRQKCYEAFSCMHLFGEFCGCGCNFSSSSIVVQPEEIEPQSQSIRMTD